jgi:predicted Zn-dependent protease
MRKFCLLLLMVFPLTLGGCSSVMGTSGINLYTTDDDKKLGAETEATIQADTKEYPILDKAKYPEVYRGVESIFNALLNSGAVRNKSVFDWQIKIINKDVLNAFAVPGGYLYVYSGLIKFLDDESQLAGVLAHEIAHVDLRHSTAQLTKQYGMQALTSMMLGNSQSQIASLAASLATGLGTLAFSRSDEYQADATAVKYLSATKYDPQGVAGFFIKLEAQGKATSNTPPFLSTHPSPADRIQKIQEAWVANGSKKGEGDGKFAKNYAALKRLIP